MNEEKKIYLALSLLPELGHILFLRLLKFFGTATKIISATFSQLIQVEGVSKKLANNILQYKKLVNLDKELEKLEKLKIKILPFTDEEYPSNLKYIFDPPPLLYIKGDMIKEDKIAIAIVGSRITTLYGRMMAEKLSKQLIEEGFTIVSGLARGIDTIAHISALKAKGRTIAVLGCGINVVYPPENRKIMDEIASKGVVISEFPLSTLPHKRNFPLRNRIISGLSLGTVVVEASERSGALITANLALEQGREVFAIPGNINSRYSLGTNKLIKEGAKLVEDVTDIVEELKISLPKKEKKSKEEIYQFKEDEKMIYNIISNSTSLHIDSILSQSKLEINKVLEILTRLEIKGLIKQLPGKQFTCINASK